MLLTECLVTSETTPIVSTHSRLADACNPQTVADVSRSAVGDPKDEPKVNLRFLVKWQNYSHIHNTWETFEYLKRFRGFKRVENYIKGVFEVQQRIMNDPATSREDIEALQIEKERQADQIEGYKKVERIIAERNAPANADIDHDHLEYLCKWTGLIYAESTWEDLDTVQAIAADAVENYLERTGSAYLPHRSTNYNKGNRPKFNKLVEVPEYITKCGTLKEFQVTGLNWLAYLWSRGENGILADEMGLGKTVQSCSILNYLFHAQQQYGPFLGVVPLSTLPAWQMQLAQWAPDLNVIAYTGNGASREIIREYEFGSPKKLKFNVLLTTYEFALKDRGPLGAIKWQYLAVDEVSPSARFDCSSLILSSH
jgi:chromodomain-helicase-DNA-binding protein 1